MKRKDMRNSCSLIPPPQSAAWEIQDVCKKYSTKSVSVNKMERFERPIFLRSPMLDYENVDHKLDQKPDKPCSFRKITSEKEPNPLVYTPVTGIKLDCPLNYRSRTLNPYTYAPLKPWEPQPQFWYDEKVSHKGPTWPVGNPDDYSFKTIQPPPKEGYPILEALEIERPERYIPGEIYKNKVPKEPVKDLTGTGGCTPKWVPKKEELFNSKLEPSTLPTQPLFVDYIKGTEMKFDGKLLPPDEAFHKRTESFERMVDKFKFVRQSKDSDKNNKYELPYNEYIPVNAAARLMKSCCDNCMPKCCKTDKRIARNQQECSCCNSKYV